MIKLNKKIKFLLVCSFANVMILKGINKYKELYDKYTINLNEISSQEIKQNTQKNENPFELIENFSVDDYYINKLITTLYNPPLTNKLYPKSNLYGHELIRYFDQ